MELSYAGDVVINIIKIQRGKMGLFRKKEIPNPYDFDNIIIAREKDRINRESQLKKLVHMDKINELIRISESTRTRL